MGGTSIRARKDERVCRAHIMQTNTVRKGLVELFTRRPYNLFSRAPTMPLFLLPSTALFPSLYDELFDDYEQLDTFTQSENHAQRPAKDSHCHSTQQVPTEVGRRRKSLASIWKRKVHHQ
ncbi:hypothetical protein RB195_012437 [Necator americanus]|uniref:Uncharacterized protein n=1 Tax=Necator americanus TaxID=51031 RepID=A0ABR1D745_NECAM